MAQFTDAQINEYVQANIGNPQAIADAAQQYGVSAADLTRATGYDAGTVGNYFGNAGISFGQPVTQAQATTPPAMTVNDLYTQVLGRAPDEGGLAYWQNAFGSGPVTADQQASFMQAAQSELANRSATEQQQLAPNLVNQQVTGAPAAAQAPAYPNRPDETGFAPQTPPPPVQQSATDPFAIQQNIIAQEQARNTGLPSLQATTPAPVTPPPPVQGSITPIDANSKVVNDLYASIGRTGMGTATNQIDQGGFDYWKQMLDSGMTPDQVKSQFQSTVNDFLTSKQADPYSQYVAPIYLKSVTDNLANNTTLSAFDKNNQIFETAQKYGMDDAAIDKAFGKTAADAYRTQYGAQIKDFITNTLAKDEGTTFSELAAIKSAAQQVGLDPAEIAKYSGMNLTGVNTLFDAYDKGLANIAKGWDTSIKAAGTDQTALAAAEANRAKTALALQSQYNVSDADLAKATGVPVKEVTSYLTAVKEAPKTFESLMTNPTMTGDEIRAKIEELKSNPAIGGIYGVALQKLSEMAAKDYSGEYGGKTFDSLNPVAVSTVLSQLKAQQAAGTAQYYQGGASAGNKGGFGSLDAMTEDMAKNLVAAGITDIRQVGEKTITETDEYGNETQRTIVVNKLTGEPINKASNYAERTQGNSWSGTFAGPGNTGYNVQFKDGNPIFYTTGASSSDMVDLAPILAMASFIPGAAPFVAGINALYAADQGNWKGAILSGLGAAGPLAGMAGASADTVANIGTASKIANVANAIDQKNLLGLAMSGTNLASDSNLMGSNAFNPSANILGDFSTKDLLGGVSVANALANKDYASLANVAAQMSGSKDAITAAKGLTLVNALNSNNPMAIASAVQKMNLTQDVIGKAGGGLASLPGLIKNGGKDTLNNNNALGGINGNLVAKLLSQQPPEMRAAMLEKIMQAA